jgi:hypothetical protein
MERTRTSFGFSSTADEVLEEVDLKDQHAVTMGAPSVIEVHTAQALAPSASESTNAERRNRTAIGIGAGPLR